jgi:predicted HAD superfamily Cof-like phosphohydrolase
MRIVECIKPVETFMIACDQSVYELNPDQQALYKKLITEEFKELIDGKANSDHLEIFDACCDLIWVTYGLILSTNTKEEIDSFKLIDPGYLETGYQNYLVDKIQAYFKLIDSEQPLNILNEGVKFGSMLIWYANNLGHDLAGGYNEVYRSNMSKVDPVTGKCIKREDGKILKPDTYSPPNLIPFLGDLS